MRMRLRSAMLAPLLLLLSGPGLCFTAPAAAYPLTSEQTELLRLAARAPSGHNAQPWKIAVGGDRWTIKLRDEALLPAVDPLRREAVLGVGAFLENLRLAAGAKGWQLYYRVPASNNFEPELVELYFATAAPTGFDTSALETRRMLRKDFLDAPLKPEDLAYLTGHNPSAFAYYPIDSREGACISTAAYEAFEAQTGRDAAQEELSRWIRWSDKEAAAMRDGLTPASLEITGLSGWFARNFFSQKTVLKQSFRKETVSLARKQVRQGAGWLVLASGDESTPSLIETGRQLEQFLLKARQKMVGVHPMSQILEEDGFRSRLQNCAVTPQVPQMLLRVGYVDEYPNPQSLRRPPEQFVVLQSTAAQITGAAR